MNETEKNNEILKCLEIQRQDKYKKDVLEFYTSIIARSYDKASAYSHLIIMAGYALFFSFWGNVRNEVNPFWGRVSVVTMLFSVIFFIIWEIIMMICTSLNFRKLHKIQKISPDKFEEHIKKIEKEEKEFEANLAQFWVFELFLTIIPGFAGAIILITLYVKTLFR